MVSPKKDGGGDIMLNLDAVGYSNPQMQRAARILGSLAKHKVHDTQYIIKIITSHTFSAEEQIYLLEYYYRVAGLLKPKHRYNPVSQEERQEIRELREQGLSYAEIARRLNRHVSTIWYVCNS